MRRDVTRYLRWLAWRLTGMPRGNRAVERPPMDNAAIWIVVIGFALAIGCVEWASVNGFWPW